MKKILVTTSSFSIQNFPSFWQVVFNPYKRKLTETEILDLITIHQPYGIIAGVEPLSAAVLDMAENLKVISRCGVGMDNIDINSAKEKGILLFNTPQAPVESVAELALSLILALSRKLIEIDSSVKRGQWKKVKGSLISGKTVSIIGCGRIGTYLANILAAMGCRVLGYHPTMKEHDIFEMTDLETIWKESDIISLHVPYKKETHHMIGERELAFMKKDCLLINTSRGGLIDESALYRTLKSGVIGGAALDVFEEEPYDGPLCELGNRVILTAHVASSAKESRILMEQEALDNLKRGLRESE